MKFLEPYKPNYAGYDGYIAPTPVCVTLRSMKDIKHKLATAAIAATVALSSLVSAQTSTKFDKFKNVTHFATQETSASKVTLSDGKDASILIRRMDMVIGFACEGQVDKCK